jgi:hypothetical protein
LKDCTTVVAIEPSANLIPARSDLRDLNHRLFLIAKTWRNFAQQLILVFPTRLKRPGKDLLEMIAVIRLRKLDGLYLARLPVARFSAWALLE